MTGANIKGVIFDMDGVLIDSQPLHFQAEKMTIARFGYPMTTEELKHYLGWREDEFWGDVIKRHSLPASVEGMKKIEHPVMESLLLKAAKPDKALHNLLSGFRKKGIALAVASSAPKSFIDIVTGGLGISDFFDAIVCGADVTKGKPEPDIFLAAAKRMKLRPEDCAVVEDAPSGIQAANSAGMFSVALKGRVNSSLDLSKADCIIESLNELPEILGRHLSKGWRGDSWQNPNPKTQNSKH